MTIYGRDQQEWDELRAEGQRFLERQAKLDKTTTYTEVNTVLARRTGHRLFDFSQQSERHAMGELLGAITEETFPHTGVMLSALVQYLDENDAGPGFFQLAERLGCLSRGAKPEQKWDFWVNEVSAVHAYY
jgi:hypothetical protein